MLTVVTVYALAQFRYGRNHYYGFNPFVQISPPLYDSLSDEIANSDLRILCLGGSTTNDERLARNDKYPFVLDSLLSTAYPEYKISVLNGGMDWYTSKHSLINYTTYYTKFKPDIVVVMHAINDICRSFSPFEFAYGQYSHSYDHFYGAAINAFHPPSLEAYVFKKLFGNEEYSGLFYELELTSYPLDSFRSVEAFSFYIDQLSKRIKDDSSIPVFVEQPSIYSPVETDIEQFLWFGETLCNNGKTYPDGSSMYYAMSLFNETTKVICKENEVEYVSTTGLFPRDTTHLNDDVHHTSEGAKTLANIIASQLTNIIEERNLIKSRTASNGGRGACK